MIDVAPQLEAAAAAIEANRWTEASALVADAWLACKLARIARVFAAIDRRVPPPPPLEGKTVKEREKQWYELVAIGTDACLRRALAAPWPTHPGPARERFDVLSKLTSVRISNALLALHRSGKYSSVEGTRLSREIFHYLVEQDDHAIVDEITRLEAIPNEARKLGAAVLRRRLPSIPYLSPAGETALARIEKLLEGSGSNRDQLLAAIYEAPHDDAPRIVFADVLTEEGDPRGEFITLQIQRGRTGEVSRREKKLLEEAGRAWFDGLDDDGATQIVLERGFPASATLSSGEVRVPAWATIERLLLDDHKFRGAMHLRGLRELYDLGHAELATATLPNYDLDLLSVREYALGLDVPTKFAPRILGLARPNHVDHYIDALRSLRRTELARRLETVRLGAGLRELVRLFPLAQTTGYAIELAGGWHLERQNQWAARIERTSLHLHWAGNIDDWADVAFESIVPILSTFVGEVTKLVITSIPHANTRAVRAALLRQIGTWRSLRSAQILELAAPDEDSVTN